MALSPMMRQYLDVKERYKNAILMFRLGDFYEMFFDDAKIASKELELTLTGRDCGESERAPMCGVPYHAVDSYIGKLVSRGYKVVICEQMEDPATAKGIVRRDVTRIVTKGTVTDITQLDETRNNYICAIYYEQDVTALCFADISTGEMSATTVLNDPDMNRVINELSVYSPNEIISNVDVQKFTKLNDYIKDRLRASFSLQDDSIYDRNVAHQRLGAQILSELFFVDEFSPIYSAAGAIISYIDTNLITVSFEAKRFDVYGDSQYLKIDANSRRNLELCETMRDRSNKKGTLLGVLDKTKTSPGARLLRRSIEMPLVNQRAIIYRQDAVEELVNDFILREEIGDCLKEVFDLERLMPKLSYGTAGGRDLRAIHDTLCVIPRVKQLLANTSSVALCDIKEKTDSLEDIVDLIASSISDKPPFSVREGGFIADGYSSELDELRAIKKNAKTFLDKIESDERDKTGIKTLKIGFNRVFGYYIEVSKSYKDQVPDYYIRKQTLTNGERYITAELKDLEDTILSADDRINTLEYELFREVCDKILKQADRISSSVTALANLDMYLSLAIVASENGYVRPEITCDDIIHIKEGRHPVVERFVKDGFFVPNDTYLDTRASRLMIITGPNMAGKSTYMRQTALITLMAQIGSFVPAYEARIGIVDKIFTRVGASDDLAAGQSTFMLEMTEVAYILKNATKRSLIIYDEIGRGTSTYDGMSIARAVAEYTAGKKIGAKTLFATHYHEITSMENEIDGVVNFHIVAKKKGEDITFLRKIVKGAADDSFGIEVSKLAGVPVEIVRRAKEILKTIEDKAPDKIGTKENKDRAYEDINMSIDDYFGQEITNKLKETDVDTLTPIEALNLVYQLKQMLK